MMHPGPFGDDMQESHVPMFGKNGTALSQEERANIATRRGICLKCYNTKTHQVKVFGRTPLTNADVYQGICIRCNPNSVPSDVLKEWQSRHPSPSPHVRPTLRGTAHAVRYVQSPHVRPPGPPPVQRPVPGPAPGVVRPVPPGPILTADVAHLPNSVPRGSNINHSDPRHTRVTRSNSHENNERGGGLVQVRSDHGSHRAPNSGPTGIQPTSTQPNNIQAQHGLTSSLASSSSSSLSSPQHGLDSDEYRTSVGADSFTLMKDLKDYREKPEILKSKLHGFRNLAEDQVGALYEIKDIIDIYRNDSRLVTVAIGAVWGISSSSDDKKQEAVDTGCLDAIIDSMRNGTTKDDPDAVQWALGAISCLAALGDNKKSIAEKGGIETIIEALKRHESNPSVFEWACRSLHSIITSHEDDANLRFDRDIATIEDANGIRQIVSAMKLHVLESVAQWWALKLLFRMLDSIDPSSAERSLRIMIDEDLITLLARILKARSTTVDLFVQAAELLSVLLGFASSPMTQHSSMECIPCVMLFILEHQSHPTLHETCANLLGAIARGNIQAKRQILDGNGLRTIVMSMMDSPENLGLQIAGIKLFWTLSADDLNMDFALLEDVKHAVEVTATIYPNDDDFNLSICGYVANILAGLRGHTEILPVDIILRLSTESSGGTVGQVASSILSAICTNLPDVADQMVETGICDRMLEGLCDSNVDVQSASSASLVALATRSVTARAKILESGGLATTSAALFTTASEFLAENLLLLMSNLVTGGTKKVMQLPNEIIQAILQAMRSFPALDKIACTTIRNAMLVSVPGFSSLNAEGLVEILLGIIGSPSSSDDLVIEACGAIWSYTAKHTVADSVVVTQIYGSLLSLCASHKGEGSPFNSPILTEAAGALASIMHTIRDHPIHIPDGDVDLIISILDIVIECDVENVVLMERMMDVILTLCFLAKELLIQFGVIVVVIDSMVEHEGNENIQSKGCAILALLASTENLQVNLSIAETDGIDMIVSALAGFSENLGIQTDACRALSHLSIDHESRMLISSQGGLILIVNAMNRFRDDVDLLEAACSALLNLSSDAEEQVLAGSNVIHTVISIMRHQLNSSRLQEKSLGVLQNISMRSKDAKKAIADAGGIGAVAFAIKEFMGSPSVLERAFTTMWSLAVLEENQHLIAIEGGIGLVINGMMANITFEKVQKQACGCLCTLSSNSRNKTLIRDLGGVDAIVYAMWGHYNSDTLLVEACRALSSLAVNVQTNEVMIASEGEISAIISAMRRFPQSERLQEHACVALRNFLLSADNAALVRNQAPELEKLMKHAAARFPDRCADRARQVLASLH